MSFYISQRQDSFIGGKFASYGNVLEKENIGGTGCSCYPGRARLAVMQYNKYSRFESCFTQCTPGLKLGSSIKKEKQIPVSGKQTINIKGSTDQLKSIA